jgi:hypothetical protein
MKKFITAIALISLLMRVPMRPRVAVELFIGSNGY